MQRRMVSWPLVMGVLAAGYACIEASYLFLDADTLWHLRAGEWIWQHREAPSTDVFSHTFNGKPWHAHEWLAALLLFVLYANFSWVGPAALTALAFGAAVGLVARFVFERLEPVRALLVSMLVFASLATHLLARPHVLAMPLLALWVIKLVEAAEQRTTPPLWLVGVMVVWANLHGSFILGLLLVGLFAIESWSVCDPPHRMDTAKRWGVFGALTFAASIMTPYHVHGLLFPIQVASMSFALSVISEWLSPNFQRFEPQEAWIFGLFFLGWMLKIKISWVRLALLAYVMHQSLVHTRHLTLLAIIAPVILATPFQNALRSLPQPPSNAIDRWMNRFQGQTHPLAAVAATLAVVLLSLIPFKDRIAPPKVTLPRDAIAFLNEHPQQGKVLNTYRAGGALIFSGIPVFIDGRADMYQDAFLKEHHAATRGEPGKLAALLKRYDIAWTFLASDSAAVQVLDLMPDWKRIYADEQVVMHRRETSRPSMPKGASR